VKSRSVFWKKVRGTAHKLFDQFLPMERHDLTLYLWLEPGVYAYLDMDVVAAQIAKSIATLPGIKYESQIVVQIYDPKTDCKTRVIKVKD
jgi:hypothetical protein